MSNPFEHQEGGDYYKTMTIQPVEFITKNNIPYIEGCIIKYVCRHREKNGSQDLKKAIHYLELLLAMHYPDKETHTEQEEAMVQGGLVGEWACDQCELTFSAQTPMMITPIGQFCSHACKDLCFENLNR